MLDYPLVILDVETTGANPVHDRVTEVGLVEVERGRRIAEWSTLVNRGTKIPPAAFDLDTYKILTRYFARPRGDYTVIELAV